MIVFLFEQKNEFIKEESSSFMKEVTRYGQYVGVNPHKRFGYPTIKPPWGTLNAIDIKNGEIRWKVPLGIYPELPK